MIDFHSHVLPGIDDGARDARESIALLKMLREQGVDRLAVTPHFYAHRSTPEKFLRRRADAYEALLAELPAGMPIPEIKLGAEVLYYSGISRMEQLQELCFGESRLLLLEMPVATWSGSEIREVLEMQRTREVTVVLAHVERYRRLQKREVLERLLAGGVRWQVNADVFLSPFTRGAALKMLSRGEIRWIGSDCHDPERRPPKMENAFAFLARKAGDPLLKDLDRRNQLDWEGKR